MKCIKSKQFPNIILITTDEEATNLVKGEDFEFCSKAEWKEGNKSEPEKKSDK